MTRKEVLAKAMAEAVKDNNENAKFTKMDAMVAYDALIETLYEEAGKFGAEDATITIPDLCLMKVKLKESYESKNPKTGEPCTVPDTRRVTFTALKGIKDAVNEEPVKKSTKKAAPVKKNTPKAAPTKKITSKVKPIKRKK